jgi:putative ATPase
MKDLGYGKGYKYPHAFPGHFVEASYLPGELAERQYYRPSDEGREPRLKERLRALWKRRKY